MIKELSISTYNLELSKKPTEIVRNVCGLSKTHDIFCLQEVLKTPREDFIVDYLLESLGKNWRSEHFIGNNNETNILDHGVAIIWNGDKYDKQSVNKLNLPKMKKLSPVEILAELTLGYAGKTIQRRALSIIYQTADTKTVRVTSVHLDSMGGTVNRRKQVKFLLSALEAQQSMRQEIICGDFNTNSFFNKNETKKLREIFNQHGLTDAAAEIAWTADLLNSDFDNKRQIINFIIKTLNLHLRRKLDYIWIKGFSAVKVSRVDLPGSDHSPVVANLVGK